jgi:hypothetical protein
VVGRCARAQSRPAGVPVVVTLTHATVLCACVTLLWQYSVKHGDKTGTYGHSSTVLYVKSHNVQSRYLSSGGAGTAPRLFSTVGECCRYVASIKRFNGEQGPPRVRRLAIGRCKVRNILTQSATTLSIRYWTIEWRTIWNGDHASRIRIHCCAVASGRRQRDPP